MPEVHIRMLFHVINSHYCFHILAVEMFFQRKKGSRRLLNSLTVLRTLLSSERS